MIYSFGEFTLSPSSLTLLNNEHLIDIEPQVFKLLLMLLENRHRVVTKEELIANVWKGRVVSDAAISSRIKSARQAIGDNGKQQKWIKTAHRFGFRFIGEVKELSSPEPRRISKTEHETQGSETLLDDNRPTILVLPFQVVSDQKDSIFADGLAHDIITSLSRLRWLKVIARASAFQLNQASIRQPDMRSLVNPNYCVSGSINRFKDAIDINFRLDDSQTHSVIWADTLSFSTQDIQPLRHEVVYRIISLLEIQISDHEAQHAMFKSTEDLNAWEAYHRAMSHFFRFTPQDNQSALALFNHAISVDPGFARAHAGLSSAAFQNAFNHYQGIDKLKAVEQAISHAEQSIALDRMDPLANFVMGRTHWLTGNPDASLPWLDRALTLNPNYAQGYYARGLATLLTHDESRVFDDSKRAESLSPLDPFLYGFYGIRAFSFIADNDIEHAQMWAEKAANQPEALAVMDLLAAATNILNSRHERARTWLQKAQKRNPGINSQAFFTALPFVSGQIRERLTNAFHDLGI